jgi:hypothetical protein
VTGISADADSGAYYLVHQDGTVDAFGGLVTGPPPSARDRADLAVTLDAPRRLARGTTVRYVVRIVNQGPDAAETPAASMALPAGFRITEVHQDGRRRIPLA